MLEYSLIINGSNVADGLHEFTQWLGDIPIYWTVSGVALFFLLLHFFIKKV